MALATAVVALRQPQPAIDASGAKVRLATRRHGARPSRRGGLRATRYGLLRSNATGLAAARVSDRAVGTVIRSTRGARAARALVVALAVLAMLTGATLYYCTAMPGESLSGALPALTAAESNVAQELRR